jgi:hypothetical protein
MADLQKRAQHRIAIGKPLPGDEEYAAGKRKRKYKGLDHLSPKEYRAEINRRNMLGKYKESGRQGYYIERRYGLTREEHAALVEEQGGKCLICDKPKPLVVDHDHNTGRVRGLLCRKCNVAIGMLEDDVMAVERAAAYLKR